MLLNDHALLQLDFPRHSGTPTLHCSSEAHSAFARDGRTVLAALSK